MTWVGGRFKTEERVKTGEIEEGTPVGKRVKT